MNSPGMDLSSLTTRWWSIAGRHGIADPQSVFTTIQEHYCQAWRSYHNLVHVDDCLRLLDESPAIGEHPDEVELAIWFHDVVYDTHRPDNELRSAELAVSFLQPSSMQSEAIDRVKNNILATTHDVQPQRIDEQLIVDIDLSILGRPTDEYDRFESAIREEYAWVPWSVYSEKRAEILRSFRERNRIYSRRWFFDNFEARARENLSRAIEHLANSTGHP